MARTPRAVLNESNPNKIANALGAIRAGEALALSPRFIRGTVASNVLTLPATAKAAAVLWAWSCAGTLTGALTPSSDADGTVTTGLIGVNPAGNLCFAAADAVTEVEVLYIAKEGTVFEDFLNVASNAGTFQSSRRAIQLLEVEALAGTVTGTKALTTIRGGTPTTGLAALGVLGTTVVFAAADAVTRCRVRYIAQPGVGNGPAPALGVALDAETMNT